MSLRQYTKKYFYTNNSNNLISLEYGTVCYAPRTLQNSYQTFNIAFSWANFVWQIWRKKDNGSVTVSLRGTEETEFYFVAANYIFSFSWFHIFSLTY